MLSNIHAFHSLRSLGRGGDWWIQEAGDGFLFTHLPSVYAYLVTHYPHHQFPFLDQNTHANSVLLSLSVQQETLFKEQEPLWNEAGFYFEPMGPSSYRSSQLPIGLSDYSSDLLKDLCFNLLQSDPNTFKKTLSKLLKTFDLPPYSRMLTLHWIQNQVTAHDLSQCEAFYLLSRDSLFKNQVSLSPF